MGGLTVVTEGRYGGLTVVTEGRYGGVDSSNGGAVWGG